MNRLPSAIFLDRDGTIIRDTNYVSRPDDVHLIEGAADAIARANAQLVPVIVVTNQSGIGRGYYSQRDYELVSDRVGALLAERGAYIDATYHCPHAPDAGCECRKPRALLFRRAATDLAIDLNRSVLIGDRWRDIEPAAALDAAALLVASPATPDDELARAKAAGIACGSLSAAMDRVLCHN